MQRQHAIDLLAAGWNRGGSGEKEALGSRGVGNIARAIMYIRDGFNGVDVVRERIGGLFDTIEEKAITFGKLLLLICGAILVVLVLK